MRLGAGNEQLQAERRADFWTKLAAILSTQQVLGSTQSNVRLASMRARRRALPRGRERFWLWVFSLIGYGERITLPLLWWLGGVVLAGLAYAAFVGMRSGIISFEFASLLVRLVLGPLAILRVDELRPPNVPGPWDTVIWIAAMILGTVCLGFPWWRSARSPGPHTDRQGQLGPPGQPDRALDQQGSILTRAQTGRPAVHHPQELARERPDQLVGRRPPRVLGRGVALQEPRQLCSVGAQGQPHCR
jgi:hypothetical protein